MSVVFYSSSKLLVIFKTLYVGRHFDSLKVNGSNGIEKELQITSKLDYYDFTCTE